MPYVSGAALRHYIDQAGLSVRRAAMRTWPEEHPQTALMRLSRAIANPRPTEFAKADVERLAGVLGLYAPSELDSPVVWVLEEDGEPIEVGGCYFAFPDEDSTKQGGRMLERAGLPPRGDARPITRSRLDLFTFARSPVFDPMREQAALAPDVLDAFSVLADVERALRGMAPQMPERWLDADADPRWTMHLPSAAHILGLVARHELDEETSEADREAAKQRREAMLEILEKRLDALRPEAPDG